MDAHQSERILPGLLPSCRRQKLGKRARYRACVHYTKWTSFCLTAVLMSDLHRKIE